MTTCDKCGAELVIGDFPFCPHGRGANGVIPDDIPGGVLMEHGICNSDGSPRRYYSKSEMAREAKARGLMPFVRHTPEQGSDKSPFTTRWI